MKGIGTLGNSPSKAGSAHCICHMRAPGLGLWVHPEGMGHREPPHGNTRHGHPAQPQSPPRGRCTCLGQPARALAAAGAVPAAQHRDAAEAAGLGDGRPEAARGAVRVRAAPGPRLRLRAALVAVGRSPRCLLIDSASYRTTVSTGSACKRRKKRKEKKKTKKEKVNACRILWVLFF